MMIAKNTASARTMLPCCCFSCRKNPFASSLMPDSLIKGFFLCTILLLPRALLPPAASSTPLMLSIGPTFPILSAGRSALSRTIPTLQQMTRKTAPGLTVRRTGTSDRIANAAPCCIISVIGFRIRTPPQTIRSPLRNPSGRDGASRRKAS